MLCINIRKPACYATKRCWVSITNMADFQAECGRVYEHMKQNLDMLEQQHHQIDGLLDGLADDIKSRAQLRADKRVRLFQELEESGSRKRERRASDESGDRVGREKRPLEEEYNQEEELFGEPTCMGGYDLESVHSEVGEQEEFMSDGGQEYRQNEEEDRASEQAGDRGSVLKVVFDQYVKKIEVRWWWGLWFE